MNPKENGKTRMEILDELAQRINEETDPDKKEKLEKRFCNIDETIKRMTSTATISYESVIFDNARYIIQEREHNTEITGWIPAINEKSVSGGFVNLD